MKHKSKEQKQPKNSELKELHEQINNLQKEKDELFEKLQRVSADYANYQKRAPKQIADTVSYEKEQMIKTLLPVLDNFDHTLQNAHSADNSDSFVKGVKIIYDQMLDVLKSHGIEQVKSLGEEFDPAQHEAMTHRAEPDQKENIVLEEFQKGYKLNGRTIRPAKVIVNKLPQEKKPEEENEEYETTDTQ